MPRIAIIPGDGIGPEVIHEAVRVLECIADIHSLDIRRFSSQHNRSTQYVAQRALVDLDADVLQKLRPAAARFVHAE